MSMRRRGGRAWRKVRDDAIARADGVCQLRIPGVCTEVATDGDHVIPFSMAPELELEPTNVVASCRPCNRAKSAKLTGWSAPRAGDVDPYTI